MNILVTGAAGFIGSFLSRELILRGDNVIGVDNFSDYYSKSAKSFNLDLIRVSAGLSTETYGLKHTGPIFAKLEDYRSRTKTEIHGDFLFYEADVRDYPTMEEIFKAQKIDKVVHLAALAGVPYSIVAPLDYTATNVDGTAVLLELCGKYMVKNFIFGSSSSIYGDTAHLPSREDEIADKPISPYAATKRMGEILSYTYHHLYDINVICARIFGPVYGPLQRPFGMAAQKFIRQVDHNTPITIYGDGKMKRDCTYIDDEVDGLIACIDVDINKIKSATRGYEIFNLGSGKPVTIRDMAELTVKYMGKGQIEYIDQPPTEVAATQADTSKAEELLGFKAKIKYEDGIQRQIEIYQMMPVWYHDLKI